MIRDSRRLLILFLFFSVAATLFVSTTLAQDARNIFIVDDIDTSAFPDVDMTVRAVDGDNRVLPLLTHDDIVLYEQDETVSNFEVGTAVDGPVFVIFVIDMGMFTDYNTTMENVIRNSMIQFTDDYFRDDIDTVAIMEQLNTDGTEETLVLLEPTQSSSRFTSAVNSLDLDTNSTDSTQGLLGVEAALNRMAELSEPGYAGTAVIYVGRSIEWPQQSIAERDARTLAAVSREQFVEIYSFHTASTYGDPLKELATGSGGEYIQLSSDRDNNSNLNRVYQSIMDQGTRYPLSYRSALGDSGTRSVVAAPTGTPAELATHARSYNVELKAPIVEIQASNNDDNIMREVVYNSDDSWEYDPNSVSIIANLTKWPDGMERKIASATFSVGGEEQTPITNPVGNSFSQYIDISDVTSPKAIIITVKVRDELGIEAESNSFTLNVDAQPMPTPVPVLPPPSPEPKGPCEVDPSSTACRKDQAIQIAPWLVIGLLFTTIIVMGLIFWRKMGSLAGAAGAIGERSKRLVEVGKTMLGGGGRKNGTILAKLHVSVARRDLEGGEVKIYTNRTTIGRDPRLCDVLLYDEDEVSSVSGVHCTIQYDMGKFIITDDNSSNGTEVNGETLPANSPRRLNDGDEVVLGDIFHRGAKFRFEIMEAASKFGAEEEYLPDADASASGEVYGGETILDMGEGDNHDTFYSDGFEDFADDTPNNETDWLEGLE